MTLNKALNCFESWLSNFLLEIGKNNTKPRKNVENMKEDSESRMPDIQCKLGNVSSCLIWVSPKITETRILMKVVNLGSDSRKLEWQGGKGVREGAKPIKGMLMRGILLWAALAPPCQDLRSNRVKHACQGEGATVCATGQLRGAEGRGWGGGHQWHLLWFYFPFTSSIHQSKNLT